MRLRGFSARAFATRTMAPIWWGSHVQVTLRFIVRLVSRVSQRILMMSRL